MKEIFGREGDDSPASPRSPGQGLRSLLNGHSVAGQVWVLQLALAVLLVVAAVLALVFQAQDASTRETRQLSVVGAESFAHAPGIRAAMRSAAPGTLLRPQAEVARKASGVDHIVAFRPDGIRWTHPDPRLIGKPVVGGSYQRALQGEPSTSTSTFTSALGPAVNTTVPVLEGSDRLVGPVSVGIRVQRANAQVVDQLPLLLGSAAGALLLVTGGATLVSRRLRRQTRGLHPAEMRRRYDHHDAVLHAVREGVLILSSDGRLLLANDEARRLLELPADAERRPVTDLGLEPQLSALLSSGREATDEVLLAGDRLLAVNVPPTAPTAGPPGPW